MSTRYTGGIITNDPQPLNPAAGNAANGVFTMNQYAQAVQNGTWPAYDPYFDQTTLLLHGNGTNGAQNNTFLDSSTNNFTITRNGNTTQGTFSPFSKQDGAWGVYFDGTGDRINAPQNAAFAFGTGDFEIAFWVYPTDYSSTKGLWNNGGIATGTLSIWITTGGVLSSWIYGDPGPTITGTVPLNTWSYITISRVGTTFRAFINETLSYSYTTSRSVTGNYCQIGDAFINRGEYFKGYISNFRIVKGSGVTSVTLPTAPLTPITNTVFLSCQSNRFVDKSTNAFAITLSSSPDITPFSPLPTQSAYSPTVNGGSGYFDGSGDYLTVPDNAALEIGSSDWTIEAWLYPTVNGGNTYYAWITKMPNANFGTFYFPQRNLNLYIFLSYTGSTWNIHGVNSGYTCGTLTLNAWNHVAITRSGDTVRGFMNGVLGSTISLPAGQVFSDMATNLSLGAQPGGAEPSPGYMSGFRFIIGTALYTSTFTPPTAPPTAVSNTVLLTNFTNAGIVDSTMSNNLETVGNAQIDTAVKKFGDGSLEFDGSGDYLVMAGPAENFAFGTGDFTIEMWLYANSVADAVFYDGRPASTNGAYPMLYFASGILRYFANTADRITSTVAVLSASTWYHIALCRSGTSTKLFLNGTQVGSTYTDSTSYLGAVGRPMIGANGANLSNNFNGYIDDLRITKGVARYTSNFAVPYLPTQPLPLNGGSYAPYTTLMLPGTGTNGAQNNTFIDSSTNNFTITRNGNTTQGTFSPFSREDGYWGNYFDGSGDQLVFANNSAFDVGSGDFTIELWTYLTSFSAYASVFNYSNGQSTNANFAYDLFLLTSSSGIACGIYSGTTGYSASSTAFSLNAWNHIACVRNGNTLTIYVNGVAGGTTANVTGVTANNPAGSTLKISAFNNLNNAIAGYVSNFRFVKGTALYTSNFTPSSSPLTNIANTSLLTCQSNRFVDNSSNNFTITRNGDTRVTTFNPFGYLNQYSPTINGGSGYFDGNGDYLITPSNSAFDPSGQDVTVDCWVYLTRYVSTNNVIFEVGNSTVGDMQCLVHNTGEVRFQLGGATGSVKSGFKLNTWHYITCVKSGTNFTVYLDGVAGNTVVRSPNSKTTMYIGSQSGGNPIEGYLSNFRYVRGSAIVPTSVPTAPITAIANTSLLLNFTNAGIYDASMSNDLETVGNAQISTSVSKFGGGSIAFDGTGDYLVAPSNTELTLNADFTIEGWAYLNASGNYRFLTLGDAIGTSGVEIYVSSGNWVVYSSNATRITGSAATRQVWTHIAVVRSGSTVTLYINGTASGSTWSSSASFSGRLFVGAEFYNSGITADTNGYISNLRVLKGVALLPTALQTSQWQDQ